MTIQYRPGVLIGRRKDGRPIYLIGGGSTDTLPDGSEPTPVTAPAAQTRMFSAEEVERFRAQEREKLHKELESTRSQLAQVTETLSTWEAQQAELRAQAEAAKAAQEEADRKAAEEELSARELVRLKEAEWERRFQELEAQREAERALLERDRQFSELQAYIQRRVREVQAEESVAPELLDLVNGNTPEEVEASIAVLKAKTDSILSNFQAATSSMAPQGPPRGVSPAGYAAAGPMDSLPGQEITLEQLRNMSQQEYADIRGKLLGAAARPNGRGLFG
ncbi:hypothetical protein ACWDTT_10630 [Streptosporangium sandarakinum]